MTNNRLSFKRRREEESQQTRKDSTYKKFSRKSKLHKKQESGDVDHSEIILVNESNDTHRNAILVPQPMSATKNKTSSCESMSIYILCIQRTISDLLFFHCTL